MGKASAPLQVAAEELDVEPAEVELVIADTGRTADEGFTAGSQSMQNSGTAIIRDPEQKGATAFPAGKRLFDLPLTRQRVKAAIGI